MFSWPFFLKIVVFHTKKWHNLKLGLELWKAYRENILWFTIGIVIIQRRLQKFFGFIMFCLHLAAIGFEGDHLLTRPFLSYYMYYSPSHLANAILNSFRTLQEMTNQLKWYKLMAEEFLKNSDQHLQMTLAVTNTITHLMENKCKWMLRSQKYHLDRWKRPESKRCCNIFIKTSIKNVWNSTTIWCDLLFTVQPVLLHLFSPFTLVGSSFFGLWRGETAQYLSWKIGCAKKRKGPNITCDMRFFPCCVAIFRLRKPSLTHFPKMLVFEQEVI